MHQDKNKLGAAHHFQYGTSINSLSVGSFFCLQVLIGLVTIVEHKVTLQKNVQLLQLPHHRQKEVWTHCNLSDTIFVNLGHVVYLIVHLDHALLQPRFQVSRSRRREGEEPGNKEVVIFGNFNNILLAGKKSNYFISRWSGLFQMWWNWSLCSRMSSTRRRWWKKRLGTMLL